MPIDSTRRATSRRSSRRAAACAVALLAGAVAPATADLRVRERVTGADGKSKGERTWTFAPGRVRLDAAGSGFLLDANSGKGWRFAAGGACTRVGVPRLGAAPGPATGEEAERFAAILRELGAGGTISPQPSVETAQIAGVEATRVAFTRAGELLQESWFAASVENADLDALLLDWYASGRLALVLSLDDGLIAFLSVGRGYPVRVKDRRTGEVTEAIEIQRGAQPAAAFTPPAGCPDR